MKKIFFAALFLQLLVFALMAPGLRVDERREFISKTMNSDVQKLLETLRQRNNWRGAIFKQK